MPFLAYIAVILVSLGGILFEVNWLTSPKLETRPAVQASRLTTSPKLTEATPAPREAETELSEVVSEPTPKTPPQQTAQQAVSVPPITPAPTFGTTETTGAGSTDFKREFNNDLQADGSISSATFTSATATPVAASTSNKCDIAACSTAYQSFRASDCSYQPLDGNARKVCNRTQGGAQQANSRPASAPAHERKVDAAIRNDAGRNRQSKEAGKEAGLRAFEREVRRITASEAALDTGNDRGYGRADRSQVIVIDRRDW
jgi:hypothetical protein